jgi:excisionase family DNA binding protein
LSQENGSLNDARCAGSARYRAETTLKIILVEKETVMIILFTSCLPMGKGDEDKNPAWRENGLGSSDLTERWGVELERNVQLGDCGRLLSIKEVAAILGVSRDSVVRLIRRGELEVFDFPTMGGRGKNRKCMIPEYEVMRFLERISLKRKLIA